MSIIKNEDVQIYLKEFIEKINKKISLDCVILFGSRAREDYTSHSDIDLLLIGSFNEKFINRTSLILKEFDYTLGVGIDAFCYTSDEFNNMFFEGIVSILDGIDHGICLYGLGFYLKYKGWLDNLKRKGLKREPPVWILPKSMSID